MRFLFYMDIPVLKNIIEGDFTLPHLTAWQPTCCTLSRIREYYLD